nr:hypothetical protein B1D4.140 [imported] - Neurospora crassa [Neurospora crassa]
MANAEGAPSITASERERTVSRASQTGIPRSPMVGPDRGRPRPRKPPMARRTSSNAQAPHRGEVFSVDDDITEVEADAAERQKSYSGSTARRRNLLPAPLSRVHSILDEDGANDSRDRDTPDVIEEVDTPGQEGDLNLPPPAEEDSAEGETPVEDDDGDISDAESFTLKDRQQAINETHPFGIRLWKPALYKKHRSVQKTAEGDIHSSPGGHVSRWLLFFNIMWTLAFGWWMSLIAYTGAIVCFVFAAAPSGREYGRVLWGLAGYLFYPFGKFIRLEQQDGYLDEDQDEGRSISEYEQWQSGDLEDGRLFFGPERDRSIIGHSRRSLDSEPDETESLLGRGRGHGSDSDLPRMKRRLFGRGQWNVGRVIYFLFFYTMIMPSLFIVSAICWFLVFWIPMGKVTMLLIDHLRRHPLALWFESDISTARASTTPHSSILICTYRAVGIKYWKYTIDGTNIFLVNMMAIVIFVIFDWIVLEGVLEIHNFFTSPAFLFVTGLLSIIPLAYFIGQAVASISAQSSMGFGAAINAFFSTIVEVFLYCVALQQGKAQLVEGSIMGSIFAGILFLPGISMCCGAIKRKTQRFNAKSAGVTSTMLLFAVIGAFGPTLFYQIYGTHELTCQDCLYFDHPRGSVRDCRRCYFSQTPAMNDRFYLEAVRPYCYIAAGMLFLSYIIGLWFTLRTHAAVIWNTEADEKKHEENTARNRGGHDAPNWSRLKSSIILMGATVLYAVIAEILVDTVDVVLESFEIDEKFLGITLFALVPNTTEFLNAISFAMNGNIALSMEIGSAYALQVCLLQIPALVLFSAIYPPDVPVADMARYTFSLLFPQWDMVTVILCVFLLSYMYGEGKSNYFKGSILLLSYLVVVIGYYFSGYSTGLEKSNSGISRFDTLGDDGQYMSYGFKTVGRGTSGVAY